MLRATFHFCFAAAAGAGFAMVIARLILSQ